MATIQKRKNKNGSISYRVMIRTKDGLPATYKTLPTLQEAKDWALQEEALRRQQKYFPERVKNRHTMAELIDCYLDTILPSKPKNAKDTKRQLAWWKEKLGQYSLTLVTPDLIATYRKELREGVTNKGTKRTPATVNRYLAALSTVLSYGFKEKGWISVNPMARVTKLKEPRGRDRVISKEETLKLLTACTNSKNEYLLPICLLAISTGMRQGEILNLNWECVDIDRGIITLKDTKSGRPRSIPLVGITLEHFQALSSKRNSHIPFVFPSKKRFGQISIRKAWDEALKRANIHDMRFHDLRHLFATCAAKAGASNLELATAMGHQSLEMLQRYTHLDVNLTRKLSEYVSNNLLAEEYGKK